MFESLINLFPEWARPLVMPFITINIVLNINLGVCSYLILLERKLSAWMQDRIGPNRVGPWGLFQPVADMVKLLLKEDVIPGHVNKVLYVLAPGISVFTTFLAFAVVPFGPVPENLTATDGKFPFIIAPGVDLGMVFIFSITSLAVYGIILGGWASNNKYSALGAMRASAQVVSYEIPLGMSVVGLALLSGSMNLEKIMQIQANAGITGWNIWFQPLAAVIFFVAAMAEAQRLPFDLSEAEQELVGGWHTEYSAMKWGLFFLGEYTHVITISFLTSILFFGGWQFPFIAEASSNYFGSTLVKVLVLLSKSFFFIVVMQMLRWTIPRFRFDQLMGLAWMVLIPLATLNVVAVMIVKQFHLSPWFLLPMSAGLFLGAGLIGTQSSRPFARRVTADAVPDAGHHAHVH